MTLLRYAAGVGRVVKTAVLGKGTKLSAALIVPPARVTQHNLSPDAAHVTAYNNITGSWSNNENEGIHLMYPSMLTAPLQFEVLSSDSFPFPLLGLVHLNNRIQQFDHITLDTKCSVEVYLEDKLIVHEKGYVANMVCEIYCENTKKLLWKSTGGMFHMNKKAVAADRSGSIPLYQSEIKQEDMAGNTAMETWYHPADMGRRYAAVSGDFNPIHLSALSASLFGFKKGAILHGMWTKARAVSALMPATNTLTSTTTTNSPMAEIFVEFKTPLYLPSSTVLSAKETDTSTDTGSRREVVFEVKGADGEQLPHVRGKCSWTL